MTNDYYIDDSSTGGVARQYRGIRTVTITAQCPDEGGFEWLAALRRDHSIAGHELKWSDVLILMEESRKRRNIVLDNIHNSTIAIIDLFERTRQLLDGVLGVFGITPNGLNYTEQILKNGSIPNSVAKDALSFARNNAIRRTAIGQVERLVKTIIEFCGLPTGQGGELFDRKSLSELNEQEFRELVGRFSVVVADALDPDSQAEVLAKTFHQSARFGFLHEGHMASACLELAIPPNRVFDIGTMRAFEHIQNAHATITDVLNSIALRSDRLKPGILSQEDSNKFLGIQAADIAAGHARQVFERTAGSTQERATAVKFYFRRVLLNDDWVRSG